MDFIDGLDGIRMVKYGKSECQCGGRLFFVWCDADDVESARRHGFFLLAAMMSCIIGYFYHAVLLSLVDFDDFGIIVLGCMMILMMMR
jgi:hypothetical protein